MKSLTTYDSGYDAGYDLGKEEGRNEEAQDWEAAIGYLLDVLAAHGIADGLPVNEIRDLPKYTIQVARDMQHRLGRPLNPERIPSAVSAGLSAPGHDAWSASYSRLLYRLRTDGASPMLGQEIAEHEEIGRALGIPEWHMRQVAASVERAECGEVGE